MFQTISDDSLMAWGIDFVLTTKLPLAAAVPLPSHRRSSVSRSGIGQHKVHHCKLILFQPNFISFLHHFPSKLSEHFEERVKEEEEEFRGLRLKKIGKSSCKANHCRIWSTGFSSKPRGFLVFSDALSILEVQKSNQKLYWDIESGKSGKWDVMPRGNRSSLQTGQLDKIEISIDYMTEILSLRLYGTVCPQVIFPLSTLSVLRDNDAVVSVGQTHYDKDDGVPGGPHYIVGLVNVGCTGRVLHHIDRSLEIELLVPDTLPTSAESSGSNSSTWLEFDFELFYKPSDVRTASRICWEVRSAGIVRENDVCWLHAVFRAKIAGGSGGGVTVVSYGSLCSLK
ncbi:hypothetical protein E5676_scaffold796G00040 [Cucumis melo var. makuwa]|uniref:Uncharacterized protein n=1 Tax=Cucumis melo var. makuwa TaxID=1194695 RepID=A0A5D3CAC6_CUCMM|nr:hypothetical protein E5676_scaffold796G00040 [Cucumis melo var. makuwa]